MPYLMVKSLALVDITLMAWWIVLITGLSWTWTCNIKLVTWFFILIFDIMTTDFKSADAWRVVLSTSLCMYALILSLFFLIVEWKEKQLGKTSISLSPGENSLLNESKDGKILLILLSMSTIKTLILSHCLGVSLFSNSQWTLLLFVYLNSRSNIIIWFDGRVCALSWNLLLSFYKWR